MKVTSRDIQDIVTKLSSHKPRAREEGLKLLNTWLDGESLAGFCKYLGQNTAKLKENEVPHSESWPFLVSLLMKCVWMEISTIKRRLPKLMFAKTLRVVVQRAEDSKYSGSTLLLLPVMRSLFNHILDVLNNAPSFHSEYGILLRHLLAVPDYRFHMKKKIYCSMVLLYMEKVEASMSGKSNNQNSSKEDVFRCILTLHSLLECPPGDFPDNLRDSIVERFVGIFSLLRDEGKISRKLIECISTYLLKDGPNLGCQPLKIHKSLEQFVLRYWLTSHGRSLKDTLITYASLQLKLTRSDSGSLLVEHLLDVVCKDLDHCSMSNTFSVTPWNEAVKDEALCNLSGSQSALVELAALLFCKVCFDKSKSLPVGKRIKTEPAAVRLKEALMKGKWLWNAAFCHLINKYFDRMSEELVSYLFEGIHMNFERIMNDANMDHAYGGLLWTLRSLQELSSLLPLRDSMKECRAGWQSIWNSVMHWLPMFSSVTAIVDSGLTLLGNLISNDLISTFVVPQDVWDLQLFKQTPSMSVLYFISSCFSRKGTQGDLRDMLYLRKNLLEAVLGLVKRKESCLYDKRVVLLLPEAICALCMGSTPFRHFTKGVSLSSYLLDSIEVVDVVQVVEESKNLDEPFDCSSDTLSRINTDFSHKVSVVPCSQGVILPRQVRDALLHDMENYIQGALVHEEIVNGPLSDIFYFCALLANIVYGSSFNRPLEEVSPFLSRMVKILVKLLDHGTEIIQHSQNDLHSQGLLSPSFLCDGTNSVITSFGSFISSPFFADWRNKEGMDVKDYGAVSNSMERLLRALAALYESRGSEKSSQSGVDLSEVDVTMQYSCPAADDKGRIMDLELDVIEDSKDVDMFTAGGTDNVGSLFTVEKWKLGMISLISFFHSVLPETTWDILHNLMNKEYDRKARENILYNLCQRPYWSSVTRVSSTVNFINDMKKMQLNHKLDCLNIVSSVRCLIGTLVTLDKLGNEKNLSFFPEDISLDQSLSELGDLVIEVAEAELLDWSGRAKVVECICDFILLSPKVGQVMIDRLLLMLRDSDYRVRYFLARRIGILFQTWEGHEDLFQDICSNFGMPLVFCSKGKVVTAREVLAGGPQPRPIMETLVITLMHLALHSDKIELEAVFMMCAISAMNPDLRDFVSVLVDRLSGELQYATRSKYLEELMGPIVFGWVACGVSLVALVEVRQLFILDVEPGNFLRYCCQWLLPALFLNEDCNSNLQWLVQFSGDSLGVLVRCHFVPIFAVCMALSCSKISGSEKGALVLQSSLPELVRLSVRERDDLIKKHMVSIVSHILSLASDGSEPPLPFFSKDAIARTIKTVVDGFMDMGEHPASIGVVDKINIFRPDRVFMFIVEIHYKITAACHHRHKCHRLAEIEVLIDILGCRVVVSSTSNYLFNLIGQYIGCPALQDQCCHVISTLLKTFESKPSKEIINVLGEQLQFLVSKLVACYIPSDAPGVKSPAGSSQMLSLLHQLILHSNPSLHEYIKELEPFPEIEVFDELSKFQKDLCKEYSLRDHLLKFVKRSSYLPPRLLLWSLQGLHKKFFGGDSFQRGIDDDKMGKYWHNDPEIVHAVWMLVRMCGMDDARDVRDLVSDFMSRVGIGDPYSVVFHLPGDVRDMHICQPVWSGRVPENYLSTDTCISEELLTALLKVLKKLLMDDSVVIIDMTSKALRGILSTGRGQSALLSFDSYERSLIEIHSRGVNAELVEKIIMDLDQKFKAEAMPLENSSVWETNGKTFEAWICPLVFSLIGHCTDVILRLCQDIVLLKAEVAELLLPSVLINLARSKDFEDFHKLVSSKVENYIFSEKNTVIKSIQVFLSCLNELRLCYVMERSTLAAIPSGRESSKNAKSSTYGSKTRSASAKSGDFASGSPGLRASTSSWEKVYWLAIDYLVVAKSAVISGSHFTSIMYVEHWCEEHFNTLTLGMPDFSHLEKLPRHVEILISSVTQINEPDSLYGIIQSHELTSQIITFEHEGQWSNALEYYDLQVRSETLVPSYGSRNLLAENLQTAVNSSSSSFNNVTRLAKPYKGIIRSLKQTGCTHLLDFYLQGLTSRKVQFLFDSEFAELQYEAAWRTCNWDFSFIYGTAALSSAQQINTGNFNESLLCCLRALQEGDHDEFHGKLKHSKQVLLCTMCHASEESTEYIYSTIIKLQILYHLGAAWGLRWRSPKGQELYSKKQKVLPEPLIPTMDQMAWLSAEWECILERLQLHMNLLEPFISFRRVLLSILNCKDCMAQHLLQSASTLRKGSRFSQAVASLHEFKNLTMGKGEQFSGCTYLLGRLEEAKLLRAQGRNETAVSLANYLSHHSATNENLSDVYRLIGKWLAETGSSNSRTILEKYLKPAAALANEYSALNKKSIERQSKAHFQLAHYADALFRSYEERLNSNEWQAAMRLRKHKTVELEALMRRLKSSSKGDKTDYSVKIQELQKQLAMDKEEAEKLQDDKDNFLHLALEGYKRCLVIGDQYDVRVVFRLVSLWFSLSSRQNVINSMLSTIEEVQSYKFVPLAYQIASRIGGSKDHQGHSGFQFALVSLVKKMAIDHPYHTIFQLLALANGDRIKDKQRSKSSFVVDMDKKLAAENLLEELSSYHGAIIRQMKQMVEVYIRLAELETRREDTNKRIPLPREIRGLRELELVPVVTATFPVDRSCQYSRGTFPYFKGLEDSVMVMNGINAPKVVQCRGSDGLIYRQLAKSGNDDLRQDAVMEQFFGLVNTFLLNHRDTRKRRLGVRTYKVVPFTPSAGVLEWVNGTLPLGEYLIGSTRNGGAHGRYGRGDWSFLKCREYMCNEKDKRKAFQEVSGNFRPVMHYFFLERFPLPSDWYEKRLAYTRSVAASSMVGYIVGLGDRHSMNILIDQATAEVVHIDLGVAFEQGLMLKTPERVPFRLTRDIIDGMGVTGVEGVFRRCCEETLSVMRTNKEALLTIVEVFIHDPLYKWALSPLKALQRQKDIDYDSETCFEGSHDESEGNKDAARALMRVKQKLDGYEDGEMRSVHGQVQQLIQDAIDPDRLCQMFPGWGAWM